MHEIRLTTEQLNVVVKALQELPAKFSYTVIKEIEIQIAAAQKAAAEKETHDNDKGITTADKLMKPEKK